MFTRICMQNICTCISLLTMKFRCGFIIKKQGGVLVLKNHKNTSRHQTILSVYNVIFFKTDEAKVFLFCVPLTKQLKRDNADPGGGGMTINNEVTVIYQTH